MWVISCDENSFVVIVFFELGLSKKKIINIISYISVKYTYASPPPPFLFQDLFFAILHPFKKPLRQKQPFPGKT